MAGNLHISISAEPLFSLYGVTITNSIVTTWLVMGLVIIPLLFFSHRLASSSRPTRLQSALEFVIEGLQSLVESIVGSDFARRLLPFVGSFFIFILLSNWSGLIPGSGTIGVHEGEGLVPYFRAPTADLNTTLALALIAMIWVQVHGFHHLGFGYLKKFFDFRGPIQFFVGILELLSEFSKIISFAFRLFGNIFAGEVLLVVMTFLVPYLGPTPFLGMEIFVGLIQALVFMMLTTVFINIAGLSHADENH